MSEKRITSGFAWALLVLTAFCNEVVLVRLLSADGALTVENLFTLRAIDALLLMGAAILFLLPIKKTEISDQLRRFLNRGLLLGLAINVVCAAVFFGIRWFTVTKASLKPPFVEAALVLTYCYVFVFFAILSFKREKIKPLALGWNISHFALTLFFLFAEVFFAAFPRMLPQSLANTNPSFFYGLDGPKKEEMVEYVTERPWVKFKPNALIRSQGNRGKDFHYEWRTDDLGFKNPEGLCREKPCHAVAVGDSFVEAMGIETEKTWESKLTQRGFPTYNLGVQGYAPVQALGALEKYGARFRPKYVIFGYTPGFKHRELHYLNFRDSIRKKVFTGGIESINDYMKEKRVAHRYFKISNAVLDVAADVGAAIEDALRPRDGLDASDRATIAAKVAKRWPFLVPYIDEVLEAKNVEFDEGGEAFQLTVQRILAAKAFSESIGAKFILLVFSNRRSVYHRPILGEAIGKNHHSIKLRRALNRLADENQIDIIDVRDDLRNHIMNLVDKGALSLESLPYFEIDGHMNEVGQEIVARAVERYFHENTGLWRANVGVVNERE